MAQVAENWNYDDEIKQKKIKEKDEKGRAARAAKKKMRERQGLVVEDESTVASSAASEVAEIYGDANSPASASINQYSSEASPLVKKKKPKKRELDEEQEQIVIELVLKLVAHKFVKGEKPFD